MEEEPLPDEAPFIPASNLISAVAETISSAIAAADSINLSTFSEFSSILRLTLPILLSLPDNLPSPADSLLALSAAASASHSFALGCSTGSRLHLLLSSRHTSLRLSSAAHNLSRAFSLFPLSDDAKTIAARLAAADFRSSPAVEEILEKIHSAVRDRASDRSYANHLLSLLADASGIPHGPSALRLELDKLRAETVNMNHIISFLYSSNSASSFLEREEKYLSMRNCLGNQPLEPLQPFLCPITGDVMEEPVETSLGHTFEKSAIEKWFAEGNSTCPLTMTPLSAEDIRPNYTLKKSIEEWRERNTIIAIANLKTELESSDEQEVLGCLGRLDELCNQHSHSEWIVFENYLPVLVGLLDGKNSEIRLRALFVLYILAKDNDSTKERFAVVDKLIESIVMSLGRRSEERKLAVALLLELSRVEIIRSKIGKVRGCIFLLVTTTNDGNQAANDATQLLENLSCLDENIVQMSKANYFKPLLQRLDSGPDDVKKIMVTTLAEIELTDKSKAALFKSGALDLLLYLVTHRDPDINIMAVKALQNLSSLPENGVKMIKEGAVSPLLDLLCHQGSVSHILKEHLAATIMNIASSASVMKDDESLMLLKSDDDIFRLFSLVNLTVPSIQRSILQTFYAVCQLPSAEDIKNKLKQYSAIQVLILYCKNNDIGVRLNAVKLLSCLTGNIDASVSAEIIDSSCLETLQFIIKTSKDEEEVAAAMGIIANLPADYMQIIDLLLNGDGFAAIIQILKNVRLSGPSKKEIIENAAGALCRFTIPENLQCQKRAAQIGVISHLVNLLEFGTSLSKRYAAISLAQFSLNSFKLSRTVEKRWGFLCCAAPPEEVCSVHHGVCSVEQSFCLLKAESVLPLVRLLAEPDFRVNEAALKALSTLIVDERPQSGSKVLFEMNGIVNIIKLLNSQSLDVQEKALLILERIFRLEEYKRIYGAFAQMPLIDITHKGNGAARALAAKILAHLNVLHEQSSYF